MIEPTNPAFKASDGWLKTFLTKHSLTLCRQTSIQQKLPAQLEIKLAKFFVDTQAVREQHQFPPKMIINMDETPVCFDMPSNSTIYRCGSKEVVICGTGAHKRRFTITLACTASGEMLTPFVTFKAKTDHCLKKIVYKESEIIVTTQDNGWMDHSLMMKWIQKVLWKYTKGRHALLVLDAFKGHTKEDVLAKLSEKNITYMVIPGGCTSKLQPLDVSLNIPFKSYIRGAWEEFIVKAVEQGTRMDASIPTASKTEIVQWIQAANDCLNAQPDMIKKSFLVCGISNKLDGSENHMIRMQEELPLLKIPYGQSEEDDDPFLSSDGATEDDLECSSDE